MKTHTTCLAALLILTLVASSVQLFAQDASTPADPTNNTAPVVTPPAETPASAAPTPKAIETTTKTPAPTTVPDYRQALNNALNPSKTPTTPTGQAPTTPTLPPNRLYQPYKPFTTPSEQHIKDVLGRYAPGSSDYTRGQASYELLQQQLQRRQVESGLNVRLGNIATSNPDLYNKQLSHEVGNVLGNLSGVSGTDNASLPTLMNVYNNVRPAPTLFPSRGQQFVASPTTTGPSSGFTGSNPGLDHVARINASLGNAGNFDRYQGLQNFDARRYTQYGGYLSREYGITGTAQPYTVPRAYQYNQMNRDAQYLRDAYGINVDPTRATYSDLWRLRTAVSPR